MIGFLKQSYMMALVYAVAIDIGDVIEFPAAGWVLLISAASLESCQTKVWTPAQVW